MNIKEMKIDQLITYLEDCKSRQEHPGCIPEIILYLCNQLRDIKEKLNQSSSGTSNT